MQHDRYLFISMYEKYMKLAPITNQFYTII